MAEYIEREAAIDAIMKVYVGTAGYKARERVFEAEEAVHRLSVADVAPVVHGDWLLRHIGAGHYWECSVCHTNPCIYVTEHTKFCPNCGARMGGDDDAKES